jgi:NDP-sugar pyrophosphorylase family protein
VDSGGRRICGIVLAGSYSWSRSPLEGLLPRPLLPIVHEPLISYVLRWLQAGRVEQVMVCLNADSRRARRRLDAYGPLALALDYYEDALPRGPAGCARDAAARLSADAFVVADGSVIPSFDLEGLLRAHQASGATATVAVQPAGAPARGRGHVSPTDVYVFSPRAFDFVPERGFQDIKEYLIPRLYEEGEPVLAYPVESPCARVRSAATYLEVSHRELSRLAAQPEVREGYVACGDVLVHRDARVAGDARLLGPLLLGPDTRIMSRASVVGPTVMGAGCIIEPGAFVSRSVLWDRCVVGADAVADACVLGDDAVVEGGRRLANAVGVPAAAHPTIVPRLLGDRARQVASFGLRPRPAER